MEIIVTGGTGFIGSHIVKKLYDQGHNLTLLARNPEKIKAFLKMDRISFVQADLMDFYKLKPLLKEKDACIHVALGWGDSASEMLKKDTLPCVALMQSAAESGIKHFIYTSSTAALGHFLPKMDSSLKTRPIDYYGATKASSENYLLAVSAQTGMKATIIRPGYTFGNPVVEDGPTQPDQRFNEIVKNAIKGNPIRVTKHDGTQFIWAGDLAEIYLCALSDKRNGRIYHGLSQNFTTWEWIAHEAKTLFQSKSNLIVEDKNLPKVPMRFDLNEIKEDFGLEFNSEKHIIDHLKYLGAIRNN